MHLGCKGRYIYLDNVDILGDVMGRESDVKTLRKSYAVDEDAYNAVSYFLRNGLVHMTLKARPGVDEAEHRTSSRWIEIVPST